MTDEDKNKGKEIKFRITQDFAWKDMKVIPGLWGEIDQTNLPPAFPPDYPDPSDLLVA